MRMYSRKEILLILVTFGGIYLVFSFIGYFLGDAWVDVQGTVIEAANKPVEGATVKVFVDETEDEKRLLVETVTDGDGNFAILHGYKSFRPKFKLTVDQDGFKPTTIRFSGYSLDAGNIILKAETE